MNHRNRNQILTNYEATLKDMPDEELIGEERLYELRESVIEARLDAYQETLEDMPNDELLDLEAIRLDIINQLLEKKAEELANEEEQE
jgi:hypothetical protein